MPMTSRINVRMHTLTHAEYTGNAENAHRNPRDGERRCGREMTTRVARERARPSREKRIETLGFSLETDDACGSLRVRDYERQLEIRSKQMDCENTSLLSLPPFLFLSFSSPPLTLSLSSRIPFSLSISLIFTHALRPTFARRGLQATWTADTQIFLYLYRIRGIPLSSRMAQSEY